MTADEKELDNMLFSIYSAQENGACKDTNGEREGDEINSQDGNKDNCLEMEVDSHMSTNEETFQLTEGANANTSDQECIEDILRPEMFPEVHPVNTDTLFSTFSNIVAVEADSY